MGGGDQFLRSGGEGSEEGVAAGWVEFAEDIIDEEDGVAVGEGGEHGGLRETEGDGDGALLAFAGEAVGGAAIDGWGEVVAVGSGGGDAAAEFLRSESFQLGEVIRFAAWVPWEGEGFRGEGDGGVGGGGGWAQGVHEGAAEFREAGTFRGEDAAIGIDLRPWWRSVAAEEEVAGAQSGVAAAEGGQVVREELGSEEVEIASAEVAGAGDERAVTITEPDDQFRGGEVVGGAAHWVAAGEEGSAIWAGFVPEFGMGG